MPVLSPHTICHWDLTPTEALAGQVFNDANIKVFENLLFAYLHQRLNLAPDPVNYSAFIQEEAELKGKIRLLQDLLDNSKAAAQQLISPTPLTD